VARPPPKPAAIPWACEEASPVEDTDGQQKIHCARRLFVAIATQGLVAEALSSNVKRMLERLDRLEAIAHQRSPVDNDAG